MLVQVLRYVLPEVPIDTAEIVDLGARKWWFIRVGRDMPTHFAYWAAFREEFPDCDRLAQKYGAHVPHPRACPEFPTVEKLIQWFVEVTRLPSKASTLITLCARTR